MNLPEISFSEPLPFFGTFLLVLGILLTLSGFNILTLEKISIKPGRKTIAFGFLFCLIGVFLFAFPGSDSEEKNGKNGTSSSPTQIGSGIDNNDTTQNTSGPNDDPVNPNENPEFQFKDTVEFDSFLSIFSGLYRFSIHQNKNATEGDAISFVVQGKPGLAQKYVVKASQSVEYDDDLNHLLIFIKDINYSSKELTLEVTRKAECNAHTATILEERELTFDSTYSTTDSRIKLRLPKNETNNDKEIEVQLMMNNNVEKIFPTVNSSSTYGHSIGNELFILRSSIIDIGNRKAQLSLIKTENCP